MILDAEHLEQNLAMVDFCILDQGDQNLAAAWSELRDHMESQRCKLLTLNQAAMVAKNTLAAAGV